MALLFLINKINENMIDDENLPKKIRNICFILLTSNLPMPSSHIHSKNGK
jgi:hypothetical protein